MDGERFGSPALRPRAAVEAKGVPVALHLSRGSYAVSAPGTTISGTASKGASISVNGTKVTVHSGRWHDSLHLHLGSNQVEVEATMTAGAPTTRVIHVVRHHSAAELEALAHARALGTGRSVSSIQRRRHSREAGRFLRSTQGR
jgi:Glucodextranase, domain B